MGVLKAKCGTCGVELGCEQTDYSAFYCSSECLGPVSFDIIPSYIGYAPQWTVKSKLWKGNDGSQD